MEKMLNLIALFIGILAMNVILAGIQWRQERTRLSRSLFFVWASGLLATVTQGAIQGTAFLTTLGYSFSFGLTLALAYVLTGIGAVKVPWRASVVLLACGLIMSGIADALGLVFWVVALPTAIAVAFPVLFVGGWLLVTRLRSLSVTGVALTVSCVAYGLHSVDFAFLRDKPAAAPIAFTVGLFIMIALSVTAPVVVLERVAKARADAEKSRLQAEETKRIQSEFFANVSHELRTPLTLILSPLEVILQDHSRDLPPAVTGYIGSMQRNAGRLLQLINNLLDLAKTGAGKVFLRYGPLELHSFLADVLPPFEAMAQRKGVTLTLDGVAAEPLQLDAEKTDIIFQNLLANALKFTAEGEVAVRVTENETHVVVEVADTGIGIVARDLDRIFDRFAQSDSSATRLFGGTGIGLALVEEFVVLQGGEITVDSEEGVGSTFTVKLPKGVEHIREDLRDRREVDLPVVMERRSEHQDPAPPVSGRRRRLSDQDESVAATEEATPPSGASSVLVVEDNADLRQFLGSLLSPYYRVRFAEDGEQGVAAARNERPDLILSDVMMPKLSGYGLVRSLKGDPGTRDIPIVLLTAKRGLEPKLEGFAKGADDYLGKPFSTRELLARVRVQLKLRELTRELVEAKKTRMLATLAAGLAHEVRNPINAVVNAVPPLRTLTSSLGDEGDDVTELLDVIEEGGRRINRMVEDLLDFTNLDRAEVRDWDPNECVESTLKLLDAVGKVGNIVCELELDGTMEGRPAGLNTLVMNLLDNAILAAGEGGTVTLRSRSTATSVHLEVTDDGPGIPADVIPRVFDPYFTTRDVGAGVGLGLHLSRTIVEGHSGTISALSDPGEGTTLVVDMPRYPFREQLPQTVETSEPPSR